MKIAHTPRPWKIFDGIGADKRKPIIVDGIPDRDGKCVANCICYLASTNEHVQANAHLITAAPDMYEACQLALEDCENDEWSQSELANKLRKAIEKAEGKS